MLYRRGQEVKEISKGVCEVATTAMGLKVQEMDDEQLVSYIRRAQNNKDSYEYDQQIYACALREFFKRGLDEREPELGI